MKHRQGQMQVLWGVVAVVVILGGLLYVGSFFGLIGAANIDAPDKEPGTDPNAFCDGVSSVSYTFNDIDKYTPGTDPDGTNLYITTDGKGSQAEGAITLTPLKMYAGLAGENSSGTVFAELQEFTTGCANDELSVELAKSGAPTITFVNDNGLTENADASAEAVDADGEYTFEATIKSGSKVCSSKHGALLVADFDKTYINNVDVTELAGSAAPTYLAHVDISNGTSDGFKAWSFDGELCNQAKLEITGSYDLTSTAAHEDNANIVWHWIPKDYDINQDTLKVLGPAVEDEDNNFIGHGNVTKEFFTA